MTSTILIVDDEASQRHMAEYAIAQKLKYRTVSVATGQQAIDYVLSNQQPAPDLMVLDMRMPQVDGLQVIKAVRPYRPELPIIILTEYGDHENATQAIHAGANDFLTKPVAIERLGLSILNALRLRQLTQTLAQLEQRMLAGGMKLPETRPSISFGASNFGSVMVGEDGKVKKLRTLEEEAIRFALNASGGSMTRAARSLGIGRSTLYRKVSELQRHDGVTLAAHRIQSERDSQTTRPTIDSSSGNRS